MKTEKILTTVTNIVDMMDINSYQLVPLQRYFLHKSTDLTLDEIARITRADKLKVYNSIDRIEKNKNLSQAKAMIFAALK